jgi:hypothetical protein
VLVRVWQEAQTFGATQLRLRHSVGWKEQA